MKKQKTDWEKTYDKTFLNIRFNTTVGTSVNIKDFISNLLQQQREDFKQTMANSNEWWNNKLRQQREEIIKEIEGKKIDLINNPNIGEEMSLNDGVIVGISYNRAISDIIKILEKK